MNAIRLILAAPFLSLTLTVGAIAAETTAEKELEAAAFATSQSPTQEQEEKAVVEKMERDDTKSEGASGTPDASAQPAPTSGRAGSN